MQRLSHIASPDSLFIGRRKVVEVMDAGGKLGESLGINLQDTLSGSNLRHTLPRRVTLEVVGG